MGRTISFSYLLRLIPAAALFFLIATSFFLIATSSARPESSAALMLKDLRLAQEAALASGAATPLGAEVTQLYALFDKLGQSESDFSAIITLLRGTLEVGKN